MFRNTNEFYNGLNQMNFLDNNNKHDNTDNNLVAPTGIPFVTPETDSYPVEQNYAAQEKIMSSGIPFVTPGNTNSESVNNTTQGQTVLTSLPTTPPGPDNQFDSQNTWNMHEHSVPGDNLSLFSMETNNTTGDNFSLFSMETNNTTGDNFSLFSMETDNSEVATVSPETFTESASETNEETNETNSKKEKKTQTTNKNNKKNKCESDPYESGYKYIAEIEKPVFARGVEQFKMPLEIQFKEGEDEESYIKNRLATEHGITEALSPRYTIDNRGDKFVLIRLQKTQKASYLG